VWARARAIADLLQRETGAAAAEEVSKSMDLSGTQGELPMATMHAGGSPYLGLHHGHPQQHNHGANGRHMSPPDVVAEEAKNRQLAVVPVGTGGGGGAGVRYRECLKNHAAAIGGSATDGCGEFMPAGEEGSLDALRCSACGCHRNFHRKEPPGGDGRQLYGHHHHHPLSPLAAVHPHHHRGLLVAALPPAPTRMVMPLSAAMHHHQQPPQQHHSSASADSDDAHVPGVRGGEVQQQQQAPARKRFRTKFTAEQKARMLGFAEDAGWRLQKLDEAAVQRFCQEVGVKRRVLKVWMHNNKHTLARRGHAGLPGDPELLGPHDGQLGMPLPEPAAEPAAAAAAAAGLGVTDQAMSFGTGRH
jgi:ZF-HD class homeobox domain-containing protein